MSRQSDSGAQASVEAAMVLASAASTTLRLAGSAERAEMLAVIASALEAQVDDLAGVAHRETRLGVERLRGEVVRTFTQARMFAEVLLEGSYVDARIDHARLDATPTPLPDIRRYRTSIGPVAVFAASNFPFAFSVSGGDTVSALAAGSAVVVKAHSGHPRTSELTLWAMRDALESAGFDPDVIQVLNGREEGVALIRHPAIEAAAFTGSTEGGRALFDVAMSRPAPIPFYGELGSLNPLVITQRAAAERGPSIAEGLLASFTLGNGQFCTKPGLVLVPDTESGQDIVERVVAGASAIRQRPMLTGRMLDGYRETVAALLTTTTARPLLDGSRAHATGVQPSVFSVNGAALIAEGSSSPLLEECFGPTTVFVYYGAERELLELVDMMPQSLTGTMHAGNADAGPDPQAPDVFALLQTRSGRVICNGYPTGVPVAWATQHGGSYPASTANWATSVGAGAIERFLRPVAFQDTPDYLLPLELQEENPLRIVRRVDGRIVLPPPASDPR